MTSKVWHSHPTNLCRIERHFRIVLTDENPIIELKVVCIFLYPIRTSYSFHFLIGLGFSLLIDLYYSGTCNGSLLVCPPWFSSPLLQIKLQILWVWETFMLDNWRHRNMPLNCLICYTLMETQGGAKLRYLIYSSITFEVRWWKYFYAFWNH